ncbi:uroporphyrinogen-III synthase [Frateuria sp. STR12]|uniref:uroporphyrinogen-III synthase n=1 Tax=Frateuria hangzhouensis TaxID=2995589 RepID=UPI002260CAF1|nr:uroporphyrinogen-III synthase [Frateuria sp. STR12]MCX7514500.1 uroporphyrinogen-III synthase [Frateuria sp. STR12]
MPQACSNGQLHGRQIVITRPAGTAATFARQVRARGGMPLLLPGLALRPVDDADQARGQLREALHADELLLFTSPAAVRFAAAWEPLHTHATVLAVGQGTAAALRRHGVTVQAPTRHQDSEGLLDLPALHDVRRRRVALIGAPGGRGLLQQRLRDGGARLREVWVYRRAAPRLDRRHVDAVRQLRPDARVLLSSAQALANLRHALPPQAWSRLCAVVAVVSSERLEEAARDAGFHQVLRAASAMPADLLAAAAGTPP